MDVSHRGGPPGFVQVDDEGTLIVPDFDSGDLLYLAVTAEILWDGAALAAFAGAQRLLCLRVRQALRVPPSLPLRWSAMRPAS